MPKSDFEKAKANVSELHGVIDELISNAQEAKIIVLVYQPSDDLVCAYVTAGHKANAQEIVAEFNPEGTAHLARFCIKEKNLDIAEKKILDVIKKAAPTITT